MKLIVGDSVYYFTESILKDSNGNIPASCERAFINGNIAKMEVDGYRFNEDHTTMKMTVYASFSAIKKFVAQIRNTARGNGNVPLFTPVIYRDIISPKTDSIYIKISRFYTIDGENYNSVVTTQIR